MFSRGTTNWVFWLLVAVGLLGACSPEKERERVRALTGTKPTSEGAINQLVLAYDARDSVLAQVFRGPFEAPFHILGPIESRFDVYTLDLKHLEKNRLHRFRQVVILYSPRRRRQVPSILKELLDTVPADCRRITVKDLWAEPQWVHIIVLPEETEAAKACAAQQGEELARRLDSLELRHLRRVVQKTARARPEELKVREKLGIHIDLPLGYQIAVDRDSILWLRFDEGDMVYSLLLARLHKNFPSNPEKFIQLRDELGQIVEGHEPTHVMITDTLLSFQQLADGVLRAEGLWRIRDEFKGGPFVAYVYQLADGSVLYAEGFIYAPGAKKRFRLKWLEAILQSIRVAENR